LSDGSPARYVRAVSLIEAELGDELVALDPEAGSCFGFNPVAASVWRLLEQPRTADELHTELMNDYVVGETQCREEVAGLLGDLEARGLIKQS
jgi:Coenzyme PQQ synthesis protein D (PqqD)